MKNLIVFEIDNVLADLDSTLIDLAYREFGMGRSALKDEELQKFYATVRNDPNIYYGLRPVKPMIGFFLDLEASEYAVGVFSSRPETAQKFTEKWLDKQLMTKPIFVYCGISDKSNFLYGIKDDLLFVVDSEPVEIEKMKIDGLPIFAYTENILNAPEIHPLLYARQSGEIMLWQKSEEDAMPVFEYLNELYEKEKVTK